MDFYDPRLDDLARRGAAGLAELLRRRPEVTDPPPHSLVELSMRLDHPLAVQQVLRGLSFPYWQVFAAACALDSLPLTELRRRSAADPLPYLRVLHDAALLELDEADDLVTVPDEIAVHQPDPLNLGPSLFEIATQIPGELVRAAAKAFGCGTRSTGRDSIVALAEAYLDGERVRRALDGLPEEIVTVLVTIAAEEAPDPYELHELFSRHVIDAALAAGRLRGLVIGLEPRADPPSVMPAEVRLALRGPDYRLPCTPEPVPSWLPLARAEQDAAAAMQAFDAATTAVLDEVDRHGLTLLKIGGVGNREITRLTKTTQLLDATVRLILELAKEAELLSDTPRPARTTDAFEVWRGSEPAARLVVLLQAWWRFAGRASESRDRYGGQGQPFTLIPCEDCRLEHASLLAAMRVDAGISFDDAVSLASWRSPAAHISRRPYEAAWAEATSMGVIAQGALSVAGAALRDGDDDALTAACAAAMPQSTATAAFGSDLTALAVGPPSGRVSAVLDACADRESTGGAVTWRLSRGSVRRALDEGWTMPDLRAGLAEIAGEAALPSAVTVLLDDVERAYGRIVVHGAACVLVVDDELLAAEITHDRKLAAVKLTAVTPTVLTAPGEPAKVVAALRKAGYLPSWDGPGPVRHEDSPASLRVGRPRPRRVEPAPRPPVDFLELAEQLLAAPRHARFVPDPFDPPLGASSFDLTPSETDMLRSAVATSGRVEIVYRDGQGVTTERVIRPIEMSGGMLEAWCELRSAERDFVVGRILAVRPV